MRCDWYRCGENARAYTVSKAEFVQQTKSFPIAEGVQRCYCREHAKKAESLGFAVKAGKSPVLVQ